MYLWPYKTLSGPAITYKLLRLTHRPMYTLSHYIKFNEDVKVTPKDPKKMKAAIIGCCTVHISGHLELIRNDNGSDYYCTNYYEKLTVQKSLIFVCCILEKATYTSYEKCNTKHNYSQNCDS